MEPVQALHRGAVLPVLPARRTIGLVENLLGPQELLNKVSSQELHVVNTTANSGWKIKRGALQNMTIEELEQRGAQTRSWPEPNFVLLNAALKQTGWTGPLMTPKSWRKEVRKRLAALDWDKARDDVRPFLERERDLSLVAMETIGHLLGRKRN